MKYTGLSGLLIVLSLSALGATPSLTGNNVFTGSNVFSGGMSGNASGLAAADSAAFFYGLTVWGDSVALGSSRFIATASGKTVVNFAVGGDTSSQTLTKFLASSNTYGWSTIIDAGNVDTPDYSLVVSNVSQIVNALQTTNYIVLGLLISSNAPAGTAQHSNFVTANSLLQAQFGAHFTNIHAFLVTQTNGDSELYYYTNDLVPGHLLKDTIHLTDPGYGLVATNLVPMINSWGWSSNSTNQPVSVRQLITTLQRPPQIGCLVFNSGYTIGLSNGLDPLLSFVNSSNLTVANISQSGILSLNNSLYATGVVASLGPAYQLVSASSAVKAAFQSLLGTTDWGFLALSTNISAVGGAGIVGGVTASPSAADQRLGYYAWRNDALGVNPAGIFAYSAEAHSAGHAGTRMAFAVTANGSTTRTEKLWLQNDGSLLSGSVTATNLFTSAPTNAAASPPVVQQPVGLFGSLMMRSATNTVTVSSSGTYYTITNFGTAMTNGFGASVATGFLTNNQAGFYRVSYYLVGVPSTAGDTVEAEVQINGVGKEEISGFHTYDNPARIDTISGSGIVYLPAGAGICLALNNNSGAHNITLWRAALTIGTP